MLSHEQVTAILGVPARLPAPKPILPAIDCINHRLSRAGRQQYLVGWKDESIQPSWEDVDDISSDIVGVYQDIMAEQCPLMPAGEFFFSHFFSPCSPALTRPAGMDISWILKHQMNALMYEFVKVLRSGFVPFKQSRTTTFTSVASAPMCPEVRRAVGWNRALSTYTLDRVYLDFYGWGGTEGLVWTWRGLW